MTKIELNTYSIIIYKLKLSNMAPKSQFTIKNANTDYAIEFSDEEIVEIRNLYKNGILDYKTVPPILINSDKLSKTKTKGGDMIYVDPRILNIREYKKDNKKFVYSKFKFEKADGRGLCLLNSNINYPCEDKKDDKKGDGKEEKTEVKTGKVSGQMKFSYCYPVGIEQYVDLTDEQLKTKLEEKYNSENKEADVLKRSDYVTKQMRLIKYCIPAYLRDKFITESFVKSFNSEWNSFDKQYSFAKLFASDKAYLRAKDSVVVKAHNQEYVKIKLDDEETLDEFDAEKKKYDKLIESKGELKTCNFGPGKKFMEDAKKNGFRKLDNGIYHIKRYMDYDASASLDKDYKLFNGRIGFEGKPWDQFKLSYRDKNKVEHKNIVPDLFSTFKYAMTRDSLCQMTYMYQCVYCIDKSSLTLQPKATSVKVIKREEPKAYSNDAESDEKASKMMDEFDDEPSDKGDKQQSDNKDEKTPTPTKQADKTKEQKEKELNQLAAALNGDDE